MTDAQWTTVDRYLTETLVKPDDAHEAALRASEEAGLPAMQVTPAQGKLLQLIALAAGARSILEIGTLGGYSTIWLAGALPRDGRLVTLEVNPVHAVVAAANLERAGLSAVVDVRLGPAMETLPRLAEEGAGPFDLVFIDADKPSNAGYLRWALRLAREGSVIIVDNVIRGGAVVDPDSSDPSVVGAREVIDLIAAEPRLSATAVQTVGAKGYDGFTLAVVTADSSGRQS